MCDKGGVMGKNRFNLKGLFGKSFSEKRVAPRVENDASISFCIDHDFQWRSARVRDISSPGMCLRSLTPLVVGQHLVIAATNPVHQALHGTVRWARELNESGTGNLYEAGVEFHDSVSDIEEMLSI
jgi:PilZ domain